MSQSGRPAYEMYTTDRLVSAVRQKLAALHGLCRRFEANAQNGTNDPSLSLEDRGRWAELYLKHNQQRIQVEGVQRGFEESARTYQLGGANINTFRRELLEALHRVELALESAA